MQSECEVTQWILWAATMAIFLALALTANWDGLIIASIVSWLVWYAVVPAVRPNDNRYRR